MMQIVEVGTGLQLSIKQRAFEPMMPIRRSQGCQLGIEEEKGLMTISAICHHASISFRIVWCDDVQFLSIFIFILFRQIKQTLLIQNVFPGPYTYLFTYSIDCLAAS